MAVDRPGATPVMVTGATLRPLELLKAAVAGRVGISAGKDEGDRRARHKKHEAGRLFPQRPESKRHAGGVWVALRR